MCCCCCLCKTCCCGHNLSDGVFIWALLDILFHIAVFPLPLLVGDMVFFAPSFDLWIVVLIFANVILILGQKTGEPAFLTLWLVVYMLNIWLILILWTLIGLSVHFVSKFTDFHPNKVVKIMILKSLMHIARICFLTLQIAISL